MARTSVVAALFLVLPAVAHAQAPTAAELSEAQRQFELGVSEYQAGQLEDALVRFTRAHALSGAPELLYNIGTVAERLRRDDEALVAYEAYLAAVPDGEDRAAIEARVRVLRGTLEAPTEQSTPSAAAFEATLPAPVEIAAPIDAPSHDAAPWVLTASGLAVAAGGGVLVALAAVDAQTVTTTTSWSEADAARGRAPIFSATGLTAIGVGAIATVIGIVWGVTRSSETVHVALGPTSVAIEGTF